MMQIVEFAKTGHHPEVKPKLITAIMRVEMQLLKTTQLEEMITIPTLAKVVTK
ncbi:hypothetical protein D3C79_1066870 [compost metagenome]